MNYQAQRGLAIGVAVLLGMLATIQLGNAETLGLTPQMMAWLGVLSAGLGILAGFLPNVRGGGTDPKVLADRVWALPPDQRRQVDDDLMARADDERRAEGRADPLPPSPRYPGHG